MEFWQNVVLLLTVSSTNIMGLPSGAPNTACSTITPNHLSPPNMATGDAPFSVNISGISNSYSPGETYTIILSADEDPYFQGFLIQGRTMADGTAVGTFIVGDNDTDQQVVCMGNTAATHTNSADKDDVTLTWRAPSRGSGAIIFRYAFVQAYQPQTTNIFWANLATDPVSEESSGDTGGSAGLVAGTMLTLLLSAIIALIN